MIKNYFNLISSETFQIKLFSFNKERPFKVRFASALMILVLFFSNSLLANVGITAPSGTVNSCVLPTSYATLGNIVITEGLVTDFVIPAKNTDYTMILTAPTNFEFNPGVGSVAYNVLGDITGISMVVTATTITVTYRSADNNRADNSDVVTISGIQFRGINIASTGNITRTIGSPGTGTIAGITNGTTSLGSLTSSNTPPVAIGGGAATVCTGLTTPAFTDATPGGTWSITSGTGTASITVGGVVTGLTAGTVTVVYTIGSCTPATKALTVNATPAAIGGGAAIVCTGSNTPAFTNATGGGTWSITAGTGTASITAGGVVTGLTAGTVTVVYTLATCTATKALTVNATPAAIGGGAASVCTGSNTPAFTNATGGGTWSITAGTGTASITAGGVVTGLTAGNVTVVYTVGTCPSSTALTVNAAPAANGGGAATVCAGSNTPAFTNATGGGTWSITAGTGTASITAGGVVTGLTTGTVTVVYTVGTCSSSTALTVNATPAAIGGGAASVCAGSATLAFTNATGGGTWSITAGTGTASITAGGVATGLTAGNVTVVYTVGTCSSSTALTVNAIPAAIGGGAATVCTGANTPAFTNATGGGTWSITAGTGTASISAGGVVTGTTAGTVTVVYTVGTCSSSTALTVNTTPTITTPPSNASIAAGANTSFTVVASNTPTSYTWQVSTNGGGLWTTVVNGGVYTNATTATLNITAAPIGMNGYLYQVSATNACGTSTYSASASLTITLTYCTPTFTNAVEPITNVTFAGINNTTSATVNGTPALETFALTASVTQGSATNAISVMGNTNGNFINYIRVYFDWNQNGTLGDVANEIYDLGTITNSNGGDGIFVAGNISVPAGALTGTTRMRVMKRYNAYSTSACQTGTGYGQAEDYNVTVNPNVPCTTPTGQPSALLLATPAGGTTITGTFTAASPVPNNYLVVISTAALPPTPVNGTTYAIGDTVETGGYLVVDTDNNTSFTATGLSPGTLYYIYVFSYNSLCTGGPLYNTTSPANNNATTTTIVPVAYCTPSTTNTASSLYIKDVAFLGTLQDVSNNNNSFSGVTPGYQNFTALTPKSRQAQGEGVNIYVGGANLSTANRGHFKAWIDWNKDGLYNDPGEKVYDSGSVATSTTTFGFVIPATTAPGDYRIRIRLYNVYKTSNPGAGTEGPYSYNYNSCEVFDVNGAYTEYGEAEDYLFTVEASCPAIIKTVTSGSTCGTGPVTLSATGSTGTTSYHWYTVATGGTAIAGATSATYVTPAISATQTYYVTADNGSCESKVRTAVIAKFNAIPVLSFTPAAPQVCGENTIISLTASGDIENVHLINETFEAGSLGAFTNINLVNNGATINNKTRWQNRTSTFVPAESVWFPAISSGFGKNKFAMSTSDVAYTVTEALTSTSVNTNTFLNLNLTFNIYYSSYLDGTDPTNDYVHVDVNDGSGWTTVATYTTDEGIGTRFTSKSIALNAYINKPTLQIRILYHGVFVDGTAVDNIDLYGDRPLSTAFNWSGASLPDAYSDAACTIPYIAGTPAVTVYVKPTLAQLEQGSYTFTASAVLNNGCSASTPITVTNNSKVWKNTNANNLWTDAGNWLPLGVPTAANCVVIPSTTQIIGTGYNAFAKNVTVKSTGNLELQSTNNLTVTDWIDNQGGIFNIRNNASLVQISNVANTGNVNMQRTANIRRLDYVFWSSPVGGAAGTFPVTSISPTTSTSYVLKWLPSTTQTPTYASNFGKWSPTTENMVLGKGYIVRGPSAFTATAAPYTALFTGVPNNGNISTQILRDVYNGANYTGPTATAVTKDDDNWNLVGNPYPSAIRAISFLTANTNIDGNIRVWTHGTAPLTGIANPFYQAYQYNYSATDFIVYNVSGSQTGPGGFSGNIGAGQGFFVLMNNAAATPGTVSFDNTMRSNTYSNSNFYKTTDATNNVSEDGLEKNRIWLDLIAPTGNVNRTLVGYIEGATQDRDRLFDATVQENVAQNFYSRIAEDDMVIQGRALPFDENDQVPLGLLIPQNGTYKIAIATVDGLFENASQNIYLEDLVTGTIHNLKSAPYSFDATAGRFNNRFVLRYTNTTLSNSDFDYANEVKIFANTSINVKSASQSIKEVVVYDILGKTLLNKKNINKTEVVLTDLKPTTNMVIVKVILDNNIEVVKKVIY